jgi:hypothetical protein
MNDPTPIHELKGDSIPWDKVRPFEYTLIRGIAERADAIYREWIDKRRLTLKPGETILEPDRMVIAMDIAVAHICRDLDLSAFLTADDLSFISEVLSIQTNVQRVDGRLPDFVHLRFARRTARN